MAIIFVCDNKLLVALAGILVEGFMIAGFIEIQRNKNIDEQLKRRSPIFLVPIAAIALVIFTKMMK